MTAELSVVVVGPSGAGKTTLLQHFAAPGASEAAIALETSVGPMVLRLSEHPLPLVLPEADGYVVLVSMLDAAAARTAREWAERQFPQVAGLRRAPFVVCANKADRQGGHAESRAAVSALFAGPFGPAHEISALAGEGLEEPLQDLLSQILGEPVLAEIADADAAGGAGEAGEAGGAGYA